MDFEVLLQYEQAGYISTRKHPTLDLQIWNYTNLVNNYGAFDEVTLLARGLVTDSSGRIIARSFPKFFNQDDKLAHQPQAGTSFSVQEKVDGSMGLLFHYQDSWQVGAATTTGHLFHIRP